MTRSKDKGTLAESALAEYLQLNGWPYAERRALAGAADRGDITGTPGVVWEVKYAGAGLRMAEWLQETLVEQGNARARHGILVIKPKGLGVRRVGSWFAVMVNAGYERLLIDLQEKTSDVPIFSAEHHYVADRVAAQLAAVQQSAGPEHVTTVLYRPRGQADNQGNWYRVMRVEHMVQLLRVAGFGDPWEPPSVG